jgi:hypothetical protein
VKSYRFGMLKLLVSEAGGDRGETSTGDERRAEVAPEEEYGLSRLRSSDNRSEARRTSMAGRPTGCEAPKYGARVRVG